MTLARGADFSSAQTGGDVSAVIRGGIHFAMVKATEGVHYTSPALRWQLHLLEQNGVAVGLYHFLSPDVDGADQWDYFEPWLAWQRRAPGFVAVDHEPDEHGVLPNDEIVRAFIRRGHQRGFKVGRYGDNNVIRRNLGEDWTWAAWWSKTPPPFKWKLWQFSDGNGRQDWNVFNGDVVELDHWLATLQRHHPAARTKPPAKRWWLHDDLTKAAAGPYLLPRLGAAVVAYALHHPRTTSLRLERK